MIILFLLLLFGFLDGVSLAAVTRKEVANKRIRSSDRYRHGLIYRLGPAGITALFFFKEVILENHSSDEIK